MKWGKWVALPTALILLFSSTPIYASEQVASTQSEYSTHASKSKKFKVGKTKVTLKVGKSSTVSAKYGKKSVTSKASWSTSDSSVATVSKGKITAKKKGKATITVKYKNKKQTIKVTVE